MPLSASARLGPYEIRSTLGAGGMGEVYQAFDTRLNRNVAIKVLRADHAITPELRARFEREARAIAAFNHPNIVSVYDFGVDADRQYIVSELVEGSSLRSLLTGKPVPLRKLLNVATQTADGLSAAHAAGFVHRDLKPENIMLTKDGRVKIVDFGLARQDTQQGSDSGSTLTFVPDGADSGRGTKAGAVLGTPRYMSPEQALGKPADYRSDQFSFGLILYELASGKQAFAKDSSVETMAAIVREEPPPLEEKQPAPLRWIIDRCLQKEPEQRYESTRDLYQELRNLRDHLSEAHSSGALAPVVAPAKRRRWKIPVLCAACMIFAGLLVYLLKPSGQDIGNYRYTPIATDAGGAIWSPDGKAVAYAAKVNGIYQAFLRYLNSPVPVQLTHEKHSVWTMGWSSDRAHLVVLEATDRTALPLYKLYSVPTVGGDLEFIMDSDCDACDLSPDGKVFATFAQNKDGYWNVEVSDPLGSPWRAYGPAPFASKEVFGNLSSELHFSTDGRMIMLFRAANTTNDEAWLLPYPAGSKSPQLVLKGLPSSGNYPSFSWLPDNRHIIVSLTDDPSAHDHLWMADIESSKLTPLTTSSANESEPIVSPDGKSLIYRQNLSHRDVVSVSLEDGSVKTLISTGRLESDPAWAASQAKLAWVTNRSGPFEIWVRMPEGSDRPAVTAADFPPGTNKWFMTPALSPDGERLIYVKTDRAGVDRLWISSLSGGPPVRLTNAESGGEFGGSWSPDGGRFVYLQYRNSKSLLMMAKTSGNAAPLVLKEGSEIVDDLPDWSPTGEWITYRDKNGWWLLSPDGKTSKSLGKIETPYLAFSRDGKMLYCVKIGETEVDKDRVTLFSLDPETLRQKVIKELGKEFAPTANFEPGIRFSLAPDGKSFVYSTETFRSDLWMLTGYRQPGWRARIAEALHLK